MDGSIGNICMAKRREIDVEERCCTVSQGLISWFTGSWKLGDKYMHVSNAC